jgi:hypothetical protein
LEPIEKNGSELRKGCILNDRVGFIKMQCGARESRFKNGECLLYGPLTEGCCHIQGIKEFIDSSAIIFASEESYHGNEASYAEWFDGPLGLRVCVCHSA